MILCAIIFFTKIIDVLSVNVQSARQKCKDVIEILKTAGAIKLCFDLSRVQNFRKSVVCL